MANLLSQLANEEWARGLSRPSGNPVGQWIQGVAGRSTPSGYFNAMAEEARRYQDMPIEDMTSEVASNLTGGIGGGLVGMFAGKGAKTAKLANLARAEELRAAGVPDEQIWKETGWTFGFPDKKPRFEIPDDAAKWQGRTSTGYLDETKARDMLKHEEMVKNYPELMNLKMTGHPATSESAYVNAGQPYMNIGLKGNDNPASPALHELQHAIQQREGFASGGSPDSLRQLVKIDNMMQGKPAPTDADVYDAYQRLAGEAEARLTQARMNLTPEQRLAQYPIDQFDVPVSDQIVRYGDNGPQMATAWHGSPHLFDKFKSEAIGTGEGAQAYGHGLYLAENPSIAQSYQEALRPLTEVKDLHVGNIPIYSRGNPADYSPTQFTNNPTIRDFVRAKTQEDLLIDEWRLREAFDREGIGGVKRIMRENVADSLEQAKTEWPEAVPHYQRILSNIDSNVGNKVNFAKGESHLYKTDIPDTHIDKMLDWDKPLSEQPHAQQAIKAIQGMLDKGSAKQMQQDAHLLSGSGLVTYARKAVGGDDAEASKLLASYGIPGIKYLDAGSRGAEGGTRNFVMFNPSDIRILERNNIPTGEVPWSAGEDQAMSMPKSAKNTLAELARGDTGVKSLMNKWESSGVKNDISESANKITLSKIIIPKESRNQGIGSQYMKELLDYADASGKRVELSPSADFGGNKSKLKEFYSRFGFVENKGKNKDFSISESMYREPPTKQETNSLSQLARGTKGTKTANLANLARAEELRAAGVPKTEFELAHEVAQRNAALPLEQGGLGLPMDNTAMDRAKAMGFDTPLFHETSGDVAKELQSFDPMMSRAAATDEQTPYAVFLKRGGENIGVARNNSAQMPVLANMGNLEEYGYRSNMGDMLGLDDKIRPLMRDVKQYDADMARQIDDYSNNPELEKLLTDEYFGSLDRTMADKAAKSKQAITDYYNQRGVDSVRLMNDEGSFGRNVDTTMILNPKNIRSRFAAFDPMQRNSANILAGGIGGAIGLNTLAEMAKQQEYQ